MRLRHAVFCFALAALLAQIAAVRGYAQDANASAPLGSPSCALDCMLAHLVALARTVDGGDIYDPMHIPAATLVEVAIVQAKGGRLEQAAGMVARLADLPLTEVEKNRHRARASTGFAEALAAAGDAGGADRLFAQALAAASASQSSAWLRSHIARALFRTQRTDAAEDVLHGLKRAEYRAPVIADMAVAAAQSGNVAAAHRMLASAFGAIADETRSFSGRVGAFSAITTALVALGEDAKARELIATIESDLERVAMLSALAVAQAAADPPAAAQETLWDAAAIAETIADDYHRSLALAAIVTGGDILAHDGPRNDRGVVGGKLALHLKTVAEGLAAAGTRRPAFREVAGALARAGEVAAAFAIAEGFDQGCSRVVIHARIASEQAALGQIKEAQATVRRINAAPDTVRGCGHGTALEAIAKAHAKAGRFDAAWELAATRLDALAVVVEEWARHSTPPMPTTADALRRGP